MISHSFKTQGYYGHINGPSDFFVLEEVLKLENSVNELKTISSLKGGDIVFIPSWVEFPRYKLREYGKMNNISITRDINKADVVVIDKVKLLYGHNSRFTLVKPDVVKYDNNDITTGYVLKDRLDVSLIDLLEKLLEHQDKRFITTETLSKIVTSEGITLDEYYFHRLDTMLDSSNNEDVLLAMETMANCNFSTSFVKLYLLYCKHSSEIQRSSFFKSVNFNNLIKYFQSIGLGSIGYGGSSIPSVVEDLSEAEVKVSVEDEELIRELLISYLLQSFNSNKGFEVTNVAIKLNLQSYAYEEKVKIGLNV